MISVTAGSASWMYMSYAVGLHELIAQWQTELISQPAPPHAKTFYNASPKMWRAMAAAPLFPVHDADIEMLQGDAAKRQLYADLVEATSAAARLLRRRGHQVAPGPLVQPGAAGQDAARARAELGR